MKKPFLGMVLLLVITSTLPQCTDHGDSAAPEKVQFTFSYSPPIGPPSPQSMDLLLQLRNGYGWSILPNVE